MGEVGWAGGESLQMMVPTQYVVVVVGMVVAAGEAVLAGWSLLEVLLFGMWMSASRVRCGQLLMK